MAYFLGVDPSPGRKSDPGALVVGRALQLPETTGENETDYHFDLVYGRLVKNLDTGEWSGIIHEKNEDFGLVKIVMDLGGGGQFIARELRKTKQTIRGATVEKRPIVTLMQASVEGQIILVMLKRGDDEIAALFPELKHAKGDDVLKDWMNTMFRTAVEKGMVGLPKPYHERTSEEMAGWSEERRWALRCLGMVGDHMENVIVVTDDNGNYQLTKNGAKQFSKKGHDDFHDGARNAYIAFRCWLRTRVYTGDGEEGNVVAW